MAEFSDFYPFTANIIPGTSAYADGDVVGGKLQFATAGRGKIGIVTHITIADDDNEGAAYKLWLYADNPTTIADNDAFAPVMTDHQALIGILTIASSDYATVNNQKLAYVPLDTVVTFWSNRIYGYLVCDGSTPTFAANKTIHVRLHVASIGGA